MRNYLRIAVVTLASIVIICGCKKDNTSNDESASIKDKTWWGTLTDIGQKPEYYSVHFTADKSLLWSQMSGDYTGTWNINGKQLTMTVTGLGVLINADVSDDNKFIGITDNNNFFEVNSGELIANSVTTLDNTLWKGTRNFISAGVSSIQPLQLSFTTGSQLSIQYTTSSSLTVTTKHSFAKTPSGMAIRSTSLSNGEVYFGVIISGTEMKGNYSSSKHAWETNKQ